MKKRLILLALALCLVLTVFSPGTALADSEITVIDSGATVDFPTQLTFDLTARSDVNITDIRLHYTIDHTTFATVINEAYIDFTPATEVDVSWSLEMLKIGGLPTGSALDYWWQISDASGTTLETSPSRVQFDDNRYDWKVYSEGELTIYCYQEDDDFITDLMAAAQEALVRLAEDTGAELTRPARFYIYENALDLQGAMIYPQEWTGGVAYYRMGIIAIGISPTNLEWGERAMAHELAHLVVHEVVLNPYGGLPRWLDEGLAMYAEGPMESTFADALSDAIYRDELLSVPSLASPFSAYSGNAALSYAQSYSLVEYLVITYGQPKMLELLHTFSQGMGYDDALEATYGFDMATLDDLWREYAASPYVPSEAVELETEIDPLLVVLLSALATWLVMAACLFAERKLRRRV